MSRDDARAALVAFARAVRRDLAASSGGGGEGSGPELTMAPHFKALIETFLAGMFGLPPQVLPEYRKPAIGRPDLAFARPGQPARAFVELKQPATNIAERALRGHDRDQFRRFRELPCWALSNGHAIHLYRRDALVEQAMVVPAACLDPATPDARAERLIHGMDAVPFRTILETLAVAGPAEPRTARAVAESLAHAARLIKEIVADQCRVQLSPELARVQVEFRETLFAHPAAGGYDTDDEDALFANAFAQTLAFGLLLARDVGGAAVTRDAYRVLPDGIYPLLRATLRALLQDEVIDALGVGFDVLLDTVNVIDPALLVTRDGTDPILYFYEDFLEVFDPAARRRHGVFFTPVPVVRFMVAAVDQVLRDELGTEGLVGPDVLLLDPACGTGTFLIAAAAHAAGQLLARWGEEIAAKSMNGLAARLHGFELLVGPYAVAHYRLLREFVRHGGNPSERLPIYLADTLAPPAGAVRVASTLGYLAQPLVDERIAADRLKNETKIIAIIGNPPYRRLSEGEDRAVVSGWADGFWEDLKEPVRQAGWGGELNTFPDLYIAFWRWSLWKLFESEGATGRGVLCLITNRKFLSGHPYAGLRLMLRQRFDRIDIIDLRGLLRAALPAGIDADEGVFDIQTGVCIVVAVCRGGARAAGQEAAVRYADAWRAGAFTEREKLALLDDVRGGKALEFVEIARRGLEDFTPAAFDGLDWPSLADVFSFWKSGVKSQRDALAYGLSDTGVMENLRRFQQSLPRDAWRSFYPESDSSEVADALPEQIAGLSRYQRRLLSSFVKARTAPLDTRKMSVRVYRPLDVRSIYASAIFVARHGPELFRAWGAANVCLYSLPANIGAGPAVWVHGRIPDYHAFRGSYGGYAFPLWDRRSGPDADNFAPGLIAGLATAYARPVTAEQVFHAVAALLSATGYTRRFAEDLQDSFPHVPFPADASVFAEAARIGAEIVALESFARAPAGGSVRMHGRATGPTLAVPSIGSAFRETGPGMGCVILQEDQSLRLLDVPQRVWDFAVSGYRVLHRWLAARNGEALDAPLLRGIVDVAWRIEELLRWFDAADDVLAQALAAPLTCADLGLPRHAARRLTEGDDDR